MSTPLLAHVVNICRWLEADAEMPYEKRLDRDRRIGRELSCADDLARVLAWWQLVREGEVSPTEGTSLGERLTAFSRLAAWLLGLFGVLLGAGLGTVAFAYDGTHPVNLLGLLGALVGLPFVLLLFTLLFLLPVRFPGLTALREGIGVVNPGRWAGAWLDRYAGMRLSGGFAAGRTRVARWQLVVFSQWLAVGAFVGVLVLETGHGHLSGIEYETAVGPDTVIHPNVYLEGHTQVGTGCEIHAPATSRLLRSFGMPKRIVRPC